MSDGKNKGNKASTLKRLHFIRHGITVGNENGWYYGSTDVGISENGRIELESLTKSSDFPFSKDAQKPDADTDIDFENAEYFTTGKLRTEETFAIIFGDRPRKALPELAEMNFGEFEKHSHEELKEREEYRNWIEDAKNDDYVLPGGESRNIFRARIRKAMDKLIDQLAHSDISDYVLVCHGGTIGVTMERLFPGQRDNFFEWIPKPGHGYILTIKDGTPTEYRQF